MLNWLRSLWSRDHSRRIFVFHDGTHKRRVDPLAIGAALERECPRYADHLELIADDTPLVPGPVAEDVKKQKTEAIAELVEGTRAAFGIRPLDEKGGLTETETLAVLTDYLSFMAELAELARPFSTSHGPGPPSTPADFPTPSCAGSGSTAT